MGDLDELAAAASSSQNKPEPAHRPPIHRRKNKPSWLLPVIVASSIGGVLLLALIVFGLTRMTHRSPGFTMHHATYTDDVVGMVNSGWDLTNEESDPLIVKSMRYNDEFTAPPAVRNLKMRSPDLPSKLPLKAAIGETVSFFECDFRTPEKSYTKKIIFIDIDTNRGRFRYRPGEGFE